MKFKNFKRGSNTRKVFLTTYYTYFLLSPGVFILQHKLAIKQKRPLNPPRFSNNRVITLLGTTELVCVED